MILDRLVTSLLRAYAQHTGIHARQNTMTSVSPIQSLTQTQTQSSAATHTLTHIPTPFSMGDIRLDVMTEFGHALMDNTLFLIALIVRLGCACTASGLGS